MAHRYFPFMLVGIFLVGCKPSTEQLIREGVHLEDKGDNVGAIAKFSAVIDQNKKLQIAYYDQAVCYENLKQYDKALNTLNKLLAIYGNSEFEMIMNPDGPVATEEDKAHVPRAKVLFERALVNFYLDSLVNSFNDFKMCLQYNYEKNDCLLWMGTIDIKCGDTKRGCALYEKANPFGNNIEALRLIKGNCK